MADADRTATSDLRLNELRERPYEYDFFHAVRLLECARRDKPRVGRAIRAADDSVRLTQVPSLAFAPSTVCGFEPEKDGRPAQLSSYFFGLLGPNGPLPLHLTEYAYDRLRNSPKDRTLSRFLDVFHHRMLCLFYRAWANASPVVSFDRPSDDRYGDYVGSLFGLGLESLRDRDAMPDLAKLYFAGRFACQTRNPEGLEALLGEFLKLPVNIQEFIGAWLKLPEECLTRLGRAPESGSLGVTTIIGSQFWNPQSKFRIVLGPLSFADYQRFLPFGESLKRVVAAVRNYSGDELAWDLQLILDRKEVPHIRLGEAGWLGWTTWLGEWSFERDAGDLILEPAQ